MAVFTLEDAHGGVEIIVFPEAYPRAAALIESGTLVLVRGKLERDDETVRILASEIAPLDSVRERLAREVAIHLQEAGRPRHARKPRRDLLAPPRRSAGVVRGRNRGAGQPAARAGRRQLADPRAAVAGAHRRGRADRRHRLGVAAMNAMPPETLDFEEPIAVLLKEIEALDAAAAHRRARSRDRVAAAAARVGARRSLPVADAVAARAGRAPSRTARASRTSSSGCSPASSRSTATAASPTTTRS